MKRTMKTVLCATAIAFVYQGGQEATIHAVAQELASVVPVPTMAATRITDKRPIVHYDGVKFGAYDPHGDFGDQANVATEHLFLPWEDVELETLRAADAYAQARGRKLLITVEPWSWSTDWKLTSAQLKDGILRGQYDENMRAIARLISEMKSPVILRWGQEMEDRSGRFSWAGWNPQDYITAYKRMMDIVKAEAPATEIMWSPKGLPQLTDYYPGDDYVDIVGLSVFGLEAFDALEFGGSRNFQDALKPGYELVTGYNKPVWVAELGYEGGDAYMKPWIDTVTLKQDEFPQLTEVVYFNDREVHPWPYGLGLPPWRVVDAERAN